MYKHPAHIEIPQSLGQDLEDCITIYNQFDGCVFTIGRTQIKNKNKRCIVQIWDSKQAQKNVQTWGIQLKKNESIERVIAIGRYRYALWVIQSQKITDKQISPSDLGYCFSDTLQILVLPYLNSQHQAPIQHKLFLPDFQSSALNFKIKSYMKKNYKLMYEQKLRSIVLVWEYLNKQPNSLLNIQLNTKPNLVIRICYLNLENYTEETLKSLNFKKEDWKDFYCGLRSTTKSYNILHPLPNCKQQTIHQLRQTPILVCYDTIPVLPAHMLQHQNRTLVLLFFSMIKDKLQWPNPKPAKIIQIQGYQLSLDLVQIQQNIPTNNNIEGNLNIQEEELMEAIEYQDQEQNWVDEHEHEHDSEDDNEEDQNITHSINQLIHCVIEQESKGQVLNLALMSTHNKKLKLISILIHLEQNTGKIKAISQFPLQSQVDTLLETGGCCGYVWQWLAEPIFNQELQFNQQEHQAICFFAFDKGTSKYNLFYKLHLPSLPNLRPKVYINSEGQIFILETQNSEKQQNGMIKNKKLTIMNSKKYLYIKMLKQMMQNKAESEENVDSSFFVSNVFQNILALL